MDEELKENIENQDEKLDITEEEELRNTIEIYKKNEVPMLLYTSDKLNVLKDLDLVKPEDIDYLQEHRGEFQERFVKRAFFRSEFEMRYGVLSDAEHPTPDSKYWQAIGEQAVHVQEFISLGYEHKKLLADIEYMQAQVEELEYLYNQDFDTEKDFERKKIDARLKKKKVQIQEKQFGLILQKKTAKERMKEIKNWTRIIKELEPLVKHGLDDFEAHHAERYIKRYGQRLQNMSLLDGAEREHVVKHFMSFAQAPENKEMANQYMKNKQLMYDNQNQLTNNKQNQPPAQLPTKSANQNDDNSSCQVDFTSKKEMMEKDPITQSFFTRKVRTIMIGTPHRAQSDSNATNFYRMQTPAAFDVSLEQPYGFTVPDARNFLVHKAIKEGVDYIFFVDDDVIIPANALVQLIHHKADIVGGFYYRKYFPLESVGMHVDEENRPTSIENYKIGDVIHNTLVLPSGITLIKTEVFKKMEPPWYRTCTIKGRPTITEDTYICQKARYLEYDIITDTGVQGIHVDKTNGVFYGHPEIVNKDKNQVYENWRSYFAI